jgi:hypothetical protein
MSQRTLLMYVASEGTVEAMELLLAHDPPVLPNLQTTYGNTALHLSIGMTEAHLAKVNLLLKYGANPNVVNKLNETPLAVAARLQCTRCIELLGGDISILCVRSPINNQVSSFAADTGTGLVKRLGGRDRRAAVRQTSIGSSSAASSEKELNYNVYHFLTRYLNAIRASELIRHLADYYVECNLRGCGLLSYAPRIVAASAVYGAVAQTNAISSIDAWDTILQDETGYELTDILPCCRQMIRHVGEEAEANSAKRKYSSPRYSSVASLPLPRLFLHLQPQ